MSRKKVIIMGAAGRDFHNFNTYYRDNERYEVVAFTATQIPDIHGRKYPPELAGSLYPEGIPIYDQRELADLIAKYDVDECVLSYSDVSYEYVMHLSALVNAAGANFALLGPKHTMLRSSKPVIAVCATRTGTGKSQTSRKVAEILLSRGIRVVAVRHPMPYGDLAAQRVQRFSTIEDLAKHQCTIEEMEEYEPHIDRGNVVYAGVDYEAILREAENDPQGCDVILWDGGNNDFPFYKPDLHITVGPHRPGTNLPTTPGSEPAHGRCGGDKQDRQRFSGKHRNRAAEHPLQNPTARTGCRFTHQVVNPELIRKRALVVEEGHLTHGR